MKNKTNKLNSFEGLYQVIKVEELLENQHVPEKVIKQVKRKNFQIGQEVVICTKKEWINGVIVTIKSFRKDGKVIALSGGGTKYLCDIKHLKPL
jgi:hypothetical protein